jgi:hypothetical protein
MFITKKTHIEAIEQLRSQYEARLDALDASYLSLLSSYKAQIEDLRKLVFPTHVQVMSKEAAQVDAVLSASEKSTEMSEEQMNKIIAGERELDLLMSGNYDSELLA